MPYFIILKYEEDYKKSTFFTRDYIDSRRFSASFDELRQQRLKVARTRKPEKLSAFDNAEFNWPAKEVEPPLDLVGVGDQPGHAGHDEAQALPRVTLSGRATGRH